MFGPTNSTLGTRARDPSAAIRWRPWRLASAANEMFHLHEAGQEPDLLGDLRFGIWLDIIEGAWRGGVDHLTFKTSGSTGMPKYCAHSCNTLRTELRFLAELFCSRKRIVAFAQPHHIYGFLFTAGLPEMLEIEVRASGKLSPGALARDLRAGDLVVTFPERWAWLNRSLPSWPADVEGVTSTAPCAPSAQSIPDRTRVEWLNGNLRILGNCRRGHATVAAIVVHAHVTLAPGIHKRGRINVPGASVRNASRASGQGRSPVRRNLGDWRTAR